MLFFALNSVPKTSLNLLSHSFFSLYLSFLCCMSKSLLFLNTYPLSSGPVL
jgi:hypothetical protein